MPIDLSPNSTGAAGYYADQNDVENVAGAATVARWSNLDNADDNPDIARIQLGLNIGDSEINDFFRGGPLAIPLPVNNTTTNWAAVIAAHWLADSRPHGKDDSIDWIVQRKCTVKNEMAAYKSELIRFDDSALRIAKLPQVPQSVIV